MPRVVWKVRNLMGHRRKRLCLMCQTARDDRHGHAPAHLLELVTGNRLLPESDERAKCPNCGARWHGRRYEPAVSGEPMAGG